MPNTTSRKGAAKRAEILRVALEAFSEGGDERASLREIARRCGTTTGGILHYFPSREDLFIEVLRVEAENRGSLPRTARGADGLLDELAEQILRDAQEPGLLALSFAMSSKSRVAGHPSSSYFPGYYRDRHESMMRQLQERAIQPRGGLSHPTAATILLATIEGLRLQWLASASQDSLSAIRSAFLSLYEFPTPGDTAPCRVASPAGHDRRVMRVGPAAGPSFRAKAGRA